MVNVRSQRIMGMPRFLAVHQRDSSNLGRCVVLPVAHASLDDGWENAHEPRMLKTGRRNDNC